MTREEYIKIVSKSPNQTIKENVIRYINWIFDDFDSRVCENCKYGEYDDDIKAIYCPFVNYCGTDYMEKDFKCGKWESK